MQSAQADAESGLASLANAPQVRPQACSQCEARQASSAAGISAAVSTGWSSVHRERQLGSPLHAMRQLSRALQAGDSAHVDASAQHCASAQARHEAPNGMPQAAGASSAVTRPSSVRMPAISPHASASPANNSNDRRKPDALIPEQGSTLPAVQGRAAGERTNGALRSSR